MQQNDWVDKKLEELEKEKEAVKKLRNCPTYEEVERIVDDITDKIADIIEKAPSWLYFEGDESDPWVAPTANLHINGDGAFRTPEGGWKKKQYTRTITKDDGYKMRAEEDWWCDLNNVDKYYTEENEIKALNEEEG